MKSAKLLKIDREKFLELVPKAMSPDRCAQVILRGVERNKATIVVTATAKILWLLHRISPGLVLRLSRHYFREMRKLRTGD